MQQHDQVRGLGVRLFGAHVDVVVGIRAIEVLHLHAGRRGPGALLQQEPVDPRFAPVGVGGQHVDARGVLSRFANSSLACEHRRKAAARPRSKEPRMPVVVVANPKGGVGKTTVATNIAGYFASQGHQP
jgi:hypothetical protein